MWYIFGERWGIGKECVKVASFSDEKLARKYLKQSRTKNGKFKKRSVLYGYDAAFVDCEELFDGPHNLEPPK